jgi:HAD superfamily hydrolase (TIGR01549 family)
VACAEIEGAEQLLQALTQGGTPCFVVSGTPEEELKEIVERRQLSAYFASVHGAPAEKTDILAELIARHGFEPSRCLMVGDAMTDYRAAMDNGVPFLGVAAGASPFPDEVPVVRCFPPTAKRAVA